MKTAYFDRFTIDMPVDDALAMSHAGECDDDVADFIGADGPTVQAVRALAPELLASELKEYGAWDSEELKDHEANIARILWIAAGNITEELDD